jgi:hypothetical protein
MYLPVSSSRPSLDVTHIDEAPWDWLRFRLQVGGSDWVLMGEGRIMRSDWRRLVEHVARVERMNETPGPRHEAFGRVLQDIQGWEGPAGAAPRRVPSSLRLDESRIGLDLGNGLLSFGCSEWAHWVPTLHALWSEPSEYQTDDVIRCP